MSKNEIVSEVLNLLENSTKSKRKKAERLYEKNHTEGMDDYDLIYTILEELHM